MFARTKADVVWLGGGYVPSAADWQDLNTKIFRAVNGSRGGTWAPSSAITFASGGFRVNGPTLVAHGGELQTAILDLDGQTTWPQFAEGHALSKRTIVQSLLSRASTPKEHWVTDEATASIQSIALGLQPTDRSRLVKPARARIELDVQDSATLGSAIFTFSVPAKRSSAPFGMPRFRIVRVDQSGHAKPLASTTVGADASGWQSPTKVTSADKWYSNGLAQTFTYVCDQNNVIDVSLYAYYAEFLEEDVDSIPVLPPLLDGNALREQKLDVDRATTTVIAVSALSGAVNIDGVNAVPGERILVKNGINSDETGTRYANGIWVAASGAWSRATDFDGVDDISKRFFVYVKGGAQNKGTVWQIGAPYPTAFSNSSSLGGTADIQFERFVPSGNRYHSVALNFEGMTEMRWQ